MGHFQLILSLNLPIALGYLFRKLSVFPPKEIATLRKFVVQVTVPFIIFRNLYSADVSSISQLAPSAVSLFLLSGLYMTLVIVGSGFLTKSYKLQNSFIFGTAFGNYGYLGWGVLWAFYGNSGFNRAVFFTIFFWPMLLLIGFQAVFFLTRRNQKSKGDSPLTPHANTALLRRLLLKNALPPVLTAAVALSMNFYKVPLHPILWKLVTSFAAITIPMILFTIGLSFKFTTTKSKARIIAVGAFVRVIPGILLGMFTVFTVGLLFPMDPLTKKMILIQSVMPTATISPFFCDHIKTDPEVLSSILTFSTLLALATLPLWYLILERYMGFMY